MSLFKSLPTILGHAIAGIRPGLDQILYNDPALATVPESLTLESAAFDGPTLPRLFTADGKGLSPPFVWRGVPAEARTLLLVIEDADSPTPAPLIHALVQDLPPRDGRLKAGEIETREGPFPPHHERHDAADAGYLPPDPPPGHGPHHYAAQIYALDAPAGLGRTPGRGAIRDLLHRHAIGRGLLIALYERK
ncbi:MAG: YbhB/YbcL family Raf kinase inhibitor-like protein [Caulobacter sp.]|nr:YbhB/YbcL family Raf kinase inhibitor-like protein [Caulobacter sp.]